MLSDMQASCCVLEKGEEAQIDGVVKKRRSEYAHENSLKVIKPSEPSELSF
jgi:hypothetical protein